MIGLEKEIEGLVKVKLLLLIIVFNDDAQKYTAQIF